MQGWLLAILLASLIAGGGWLYFDWSQDEIKELNETNVTLLAANAHSTKTIEQLQENSIFLHEANQQYVRDMRAAEEYTDNLLYLLRSHDLTRLALAKPGLIETRINDATQKVFSDLESITSE